MRRLGDEQSKGLPSVSENTSAYAAIGDRSVADGGSCVVCSLAKVLHSLGVSLSAEAKLRLRLVQE